MTDDKLLKLYEKQEKLAVKKEKLDEQLKKINKQIKEIEHDQKVKMIEETMVVVNERGLDLKDVIKAIESGKLDSLKAVNDNNSSEGQS